MAEGKKERKSNSEESVKLFVGQVPKHMTEAQLLAMFQEFALVDEVNIIKDKATRASRGFLLLHWNLLHTLLAFLAVFFFFHFYFLEFLAGS